MLSLWNVKAFFLWQELYIYIIFDKEVIHMRDMAKSQNECSKGIYFEIIFFISFFYKYL